MKKTRESFTDLYAEKFSSVKELIRALKRRKGEEKKRYPNFVVAQDYYQVSSYEEAYSLLLSPWKGAHGDIEEKFEKRVDGLREELEAKLASEPAEQPAELPCWREKPKHPREVRTREFVLPITHRSWPYKIEETEEKVLNQLACIALLEKDYGWRCKISLLAGWAGTIHEGKKTQLACLINIKRADEPFDIRKIAAPVIHPAMELVTDQWKRTLSSEEAMGEEFLKCAGGWGSYGGEGVDYVLRNRDAIFVSYGLDLVPALPRLAKPVLMGTETITYGFGYLETLPCGDVIAYLNWFGKKREFGRYYIAKDLTVDSEGKWEKGDKTLDLLEMRYEEEMVS